MALSTSTLGIFQSDVIIRSAIIQGIADLRKNPWMLDYVFAGLKYDTLTNKQYGEKEIDNAKKWFLDSDIPVFMDYRIDEATFPCVSISLTDSSEAENTLGDLHYDVAEDYAAERPVAYGPFIPVSYSAVTGLMTLPSSSSSVFQGMVVHDRKGKEHTIQEVLTSTLIKLRTGTTADFTNATIRPSAPAWMVTLESAGFSESYSIGVHVNKDSSHLTHLHSIVVFILLRYRQSLLEARGFERTHIQSSAFRKDEDFGNESMFSRYITINGFVRQYWPKERVRKIDGMNLIMRPSVIGVDAEPITSIDLDTLADRDSLDPLNTHS